VNEADAPPVLAHVEKLLAETYRRELEREENIWRSRGWPPLPPCFRRCFW